MTKTKSQTSTSSMTWNHKRWTNAWWATRQNPLKLRLFHHPSTSHNITISWMPTKSTNIHKVHKCTNTRSRMNQRNLILMLSQNNNNNHKNNRFTLKKLQNITLLMMKKINNHNKKHQIRTSMSSTIWNRRKWMSQWWAMSQNLHSILIMSIIKYSRLARILSGLMRRSSTRRVERMMLYSYKTFMRCRQKKSNILNLSNRSSLMLKLIINFKNILIINRIIRKNKIKRKNNRKKRNMVNLTLTSLMTWNHNRWMLQWGVMILNLLKLNKYTNHSTIT